MKKIIPVIAAVWAVEAAAVQLYYWPKGDGDFETLSNWRTSDSSSASAAPAEINAQYSMCFVRFDPDASPVRISANKDYSLEGFRVQFDPGIKRELEVIFDLKGHTIGCGYLNSDLLGAYCGATFTNGTVNVTAEAGNAKAKSICSCYYGHTSGKGGNLTFRDMTLTSNGSLNQSTKGSVLRVENSTVTLEGDVHYDATSGNGSEASMLEITGPRCSVTASAVNAWGRGGELRISDGATVNCGGVLIGNYSTRYDCKLRISGTKFAPEATAKGFKLGHYSPRCELVVDNGGELEYGGNISWGIGDTASPASGTLIKVDGGTIKATKMGQSGGSPYSTNYFRNAKLELTDCLELGRKSSKYCALVIAGNGNELRPKKVIMGYGATLRYELPEAAWGATPLELTDRAQIRTADGAWDGEGAAVRLELETTEFDRRNPSAELTLAEFKNFTEATESGRNSRAFVEALTNNCTIISAREKAGKVSVKPSVSFAGTAGAVRLVYKAPPATGTLLIVR